MLKLLDEVKVISSKGCDDGYVGEYGIIVAINKYDDVEYTIVGFNKQRHTVCDYDDSFWACAGWKKNNLRYIRSNTTRDILKKSKNYTLYSKTLDWMTGNYEHTWDKLINEEKIGEIKECKKCMTPKPSEKFFNDLCKDCQDKELEIEESISNMLVEVWNKFLLLKPTHDCDIDDFRNGIHELQKVMGMRELRRLMPEKYPIKINELN